MILSLVVGLALAVVTDTNAADLQSGRWTLGSVERTDAVGMTFRYQTNGQFGDHTSTVRLTDLGLTMNQITGPEKPVAFNIVREPGTISCQGVVGSAAGRGTFTYTRSAAFDNALTSRGLELPSSAESLRLAFAGMNTSFIDGLSEFRAHQLHTSQLARAADHGVTPAFAEGLASQGFPVSSLLQLVGLADHGVTVPFARAMQAEKFSRRLTVNDLVALVDQGVSPAFVDRLRACGGWDGSVEQAVALRARGYNTRSCRVRAS